MNIKGIIFDLDGTLVNTIEDIGDAANMLLKLHGYSQYSSQDFIRWIGNGAAKFIENAIGKEVDPELLKDYVSEFKEIYQENLHNKSRLYEGIPQVLDELSTKGLKLAILSNKPHHLTEAVVRHYLSAWDFHPVLGQRIHVPRKPDPAAAIEIADKLDIPVNRFLFVGDSMGDLRTSAAAGMMPVGVSWGYGLREEQSLNGETLIHHPQEILSLL
ncbi:MAG: HAD-IA family hydrolase [Bacteroidota bacterium]